MDGDYRLAVRSASSDETLAFAFELGRLLLGGETLGLVGELGSGKTTFTRGLARGLGLDDPRLVSSPTYVLEHVYPARVAVHHYDAYRLDSIEEFNALGVHEQIGKQSVIVVEWADKVLSALPPERLLVHLTLPAGDVGAETRDVNLSGLADYWALKLEPLKFLLPRVDR